MTALLDLEGHLVFYRSYHNNHKNVSIHVCCIPVILITAIGILSPVELFGNFYPYINLGSLLALTYGLYYIALDWKLGTPSAVFLLSVAYLLKLVYLDLGTSSEEFTKTHFIYTCVSLHVLSWLAQFYGHFVYEKRAPALLDNLLQAVVLAPYFVVFELAFWLGYRLDLKKSMDNRVGVLIRDLKLREKAAHGQ
ncbi:uncharacterized protein PRCAT00001369001 [Priceomyces carsonii]|uniref:uncharacterized protein n=1 Tax=Priceomyces carsonii TaxID=28549 RepID=UPI002ED7CAC5|nr:unnamed protein product [Priceomyces carsonii]